MRRGWLPPLALAAYALAFGWKALGGGVLAFDDHPGQVYRLSHALTIGLAPWRLNPGWWAGYAELQFYPPGFSYLGAVIHFASLGLLDLAATYQVLLWLTFLLPVAATYLLLARTLQSPWLALPGALLALTLSGGSRSGVEEGLRWGLVAARLGWGLLPLLALLLQRSVEREAPPIGAAVLLAAIVLVHPAHAPAGAALVLLASWHLRPCRARARRALLTLSVAAGLVAFWALPLIAHLDMALPLAWGEPSLGTLARSVAVQPLLATLVAASGVGWWAVRRGERVPAALWLSDWPLVMAGAIALDALVMTPLRFSWLPADRLLDSLFLSLIVGASLALSALHRARARMPASGLAAISIALCVALSSVSGAEETLSLWPRPWPNEWPTYEAVARETQIPDLWAALEGVPAGRILFVRSGVPLEHRPDWRRPHTHITALTPLRTGRQILNGTFTHPSPIAGLFYTGSPINRPITMLVEQRDGLTLFGQPLSDLAPSTFSELADRFLVSAVVALEEDLGRVGFADGNPMFGARARVGPFLLWSARAPRPLPEQTGAQRWRVTLSTSREAWRSTGMAYSPLWHCAARGRPLATRRDDLGLLEVKIPPGDAIPVDLEHRPGIPEWSGLGLSAITLVAVLVDGHRRRPRLRGTWPGLRNRGRSYA
ncbi:MAG: hypothetical protein C5B48_13120 [Candidatus Rokuibacteriota bacterium]|nr:MAG: hypothetical protein C5B48_13120 [Candidatus Rokubacteria bacterium]